MCLMRACHLIERQLGCGSDDLSGSLVQESGDCLLACSEDDGDSEKRLKRRKSCRDTGVSDRDDSRPRR
jgi:hypothetical protein